MACVECYEDIIDGKDGAMLCEGLCDGWLHRHYGGLSLTHFDAMSVSLALSSVLGVLKQVTRKNWWT